MNARFLVVAAFCLVIPSAWAVNKCVGPNGKTVFQDLPCAGKGESLLVRPASGAAPSAPATTAKSGDTPGGSAEQQDAPQGKTYVDQLARAQAERERRDKWFAMRNAGQALDRQVSQCDQEQRRIQGQKSYANNNLAGATWEVSISNQMQAAAALCTERIKRAQSQYDTAKETCERIKCIPAAY